jgi:hypothetical protein
MRKRFKLGMALGAMALAVAAGKPAQAAVVNPGFEDSPDFNGWTVTGSTAIQDVTFRAPAEGALEAVMSNGPSSAIGGSGSPQTAASLETFLGLSAGALSAVGGGTATNGSAIKQVGITGAAGDTISFKFDFFTNEHRPTTFNDFAVVVIDGVATKLSDVNIVNAPLSAPPPVGGGGENAGINAYLNVPSQGQGTETGYLTGSVTLLGGGPHTLGFAVLNLGDTNGSSGLIVDAITQQPGGGGGGAIPLPAGVYLMPLGLVAAGAYSLKLRRTAVAC